MSLVGAARSRAARTPQVTAFTFLERGEREAGSLSYAQLDLRARAIAARLQAHGAAGKPVALAAPSGLAFVEAFFGCLYAGAIAVPMPDFDTRRGRERAAAILRDAAPQLVLCAAPLDLQVPQIAVGTIEDGAARDWREPRLEPETLAFLQYTSGSTSTPRGAMVSHGALGANLAMIAGAFRLDAGTRGVSWLPLYHDMGLIAGVAAPVFAGVPSVLLPPLAFLQNPLRWLSAISRARGSTSGAPTFAYELCARSLEKAAPQGLDLSCWKIAFCGGEPVRAEALARFARAAAPLGFDARALMPCYGLAEATLLVSAAEPGSGVRSIVAPDGRERVDCGRACAGQRVRVAEGEEGELLVEGANLATGYWNRPEASAELFRQIGNQRFLRTGDLGFVRDGHVVLTGRLKDLMVIRGANHHPEDIERTVRGAHPALAAGAGAAFSVDAGQGEELVVVHELARAEGAPEAAGQAAAARIVEEHGLAAREVVLIRPLTLPRTANGKVQRGRSREAYLAGTLAVLTRHVSRL